MNTIIFLFITSLLLNFGLMKFGNRLLFTKNKLNQIQDIHFGSVSRLGGLVIFLCSGVFLYFEYLEYRIFLAISFFILIPSLIEDFGFNIKPSLRLLCIILGCFILTFQLDQLPQFEFGPLNLIANNAIFQIIFYTLAMAAVINGQNIIDGTNGLSALTAMSIFSSLWYLGFLVSNQDLMHISFIIIVLLISFLLFNYPFGKIFLGDMGSYFLGLLASYLVIQTFATYPELPTWSAIIILFYPTLEVIFSYFRKLIVRQSPLKPDNLHLHLKIFFLLGKDNPKRRLYNALVAPFLSIIWLTPLTLLPLSLNLPHLSLLVVFILIIIYFFFYFAIPGPSKIKKKNFNKF